MLRVMRRIPPALTEVVNAAFEFELEVSELILSKGNTPMRGSSMSGDWMLRAFDDEQRLIHKNGAIFSNWNILSGTGTEVGSFDGANIVLTEWPGGSNNKTRFLAAAVEVNNTAVSKLSFRLENAPVAPKSFSFQCKIWRVNGVTGEPTEIIGYSNEDGVVYIIRSGDYFVH